MPWSEPLMWGVAAIVAGAMELWAMWLHGSLWHGPLWFGHRSHHQPRAGSWEANDAFALGHALVAMAAIIGGLEALTGAAQALAVGVGVGMTAFGVAYFVVHDGLVHGRLPVAALARWRWLRHVRNAHQVHHRDGGAPYGLFLGVQELRWRARRSVASQPRRAKAATSAPGPLAPHPSHHRTT